MADNKEQAGKVTPERARAEAQAKSKEVKHILNRIKASKAKRAANRPRPRVTTGSE